MKKVEVFFPGKVIISGEHSVVYGEPALVASLDLGIKVFVKEGVLQEKWKNDQYLQGLFKIFEEWSALKLEDFSLEVESNLPEQSGLGSSAAFAAAIFQALTDFYDLNLSKDELFSLTLKGENLIHGNSSGVDPAIVINQGLLIYQKGKEFKNLETNFKGQFFLINSGKAAESTGEMVAKVATVENRDDLIKEMGRITKKIISSFESGNFKQELFKENQRLLEKIGVVGAKASKLIKQLEENEAVAKVTGAGGLQSGSGYILALHENSEKFSKILESQGLEFIKISLGSFKSKEL